MKYGLEAKKYLLVANQYHKSIQFLSFITLGLALYHGHFFNLNTWLGIGFLVFLTGLYALPILPKAKNLRSLGGLKIFVVALVWAGATVILPVLVVSEPLTWDVYVETVQCFILVFVLLIPFEIRDLVYDQEDMQTLPQRFGVAKTKIFGAFATLLYFFMTFLKDDIGSKELFLKGILYLTLGIVMFTTKRKQSKYFASFWIEAIPIFWLVIWVLSEKLFSLYPEVALSF